MTANGLISEQYLRNYVQLCKSAEKSGQTLQKEEQSNKLTTRAFLVLR